MPVSGDMRLIVVGSASFFARYSLPEHPRNLVGHVCINWRAGPNDAPYRWEFTEDSRDFSVPWTPAPSKRIKR